MNRTIPETRLTQQQNNQLHNQQNKITTEGNQFLEDISSNKPQSTSTQKKTGTIGKTLQTLTSIKMTILKPTVSVQDDFHKILQREIAKSEKKDLQNAKTIHRENTKAEKLELQNAKTSQQETS